MTLRRQLLLVSLLLLAIPWAGSKFIRENENALREGQARALEATARAIAASFSNRLNLLYPEAARLAEPPTPSRSLYAQPAESPVQLDGYAEGWSDGWTGHFKNADAALPTELRYRALTRNRQLYLLLAVKDAQPVYDNPGLSPEPNGDRVLISTWLDGKRQEYVISTAAPGAVRGQYAGRRHPSAAAESIHGYWQDTASGYTLELALPLAMTGGRLGITAINVGRSGAKPATAGNISILDTQAPPWLLYSPPNLQSALQVFVQPGQLLQVFEASNRLLATRESTQSRASVNGQHTFWLLRWVYRKLLSGEELSALPKVAIDGELQAPELRDANSGYTSSHWYRDARKRTVLVSAAPIKDIHGRPVGAIRISQSSDEYLSLTDHAFSTLLGYSLLAIGIAVLGLLGYASLISWRIGRLSRAAGNVVLHGKVNLDSFPKSTAGDEIGQLTRNYASLLREIQSYNDYLHTLSHKLSHELRTPIAVIQSSLDNLESGDQTQRDPATFIRRARGGLARLTRILAAMTEANRLEESVHGEQLVALDLVPLLQEILPAYQAAYQECVFRLDVLPKTAPKTARVMAAPDLLAQALDKLVENAASFTPPGGEVRLSVCAFGNGWSLSVENEGPLLPEKMQGQLFEAMVSVRENQAKEKVHLGLGLYIVKLVMDYHGGTVQALNRTDGSGVVFRLLLPAATNDG